MMVHPPFIKPEEPAPATARPAINMGDELASAQMREPISKTKRKLRNTNLLRKNVYNFPARGCRAPLCPHIVSRLDGLAVRRWRLKCLLPDPLGVRVVHSRYQCIRPGVPPNISRFVQVGRDDWRGSADDGVVQVHQEDDHRHARDEARQLIAIDVLST